MVLSIYEAVKKYCPPVVLLFLLFPFQLNVFSQTRIPYAGKNIFISGMNVAWVNFDGDLGPSQIDTAKFRSIFTTVHNNGGNVMRLWLFTDGTRTPEYNSSGKVTGPGVNAIKDLQTILSIAEQSYIGLQLCLWSHDMMRTSLSSTVLTRNKNFLSDTSYTMAFIRNALIPLVKSVKDNPAITGWEVFNEPEGFSNEFGWGDRIHVPISDIQTVVNLIAGAIHRTDPGALVTSGANTIQTLTDVNVVSKVTAQASINSLTTAQKDSLTAYFNTVHRTNLTADQYINYLLKVSALPNQNYYRDDRLIGTGGDSLGTLDYYNVHFYGTQAQSPFNHPYSVWQLTKPLVVGEFFMQDTYGVPYSKLFEQLYLTGYAGAMSWQWWGDTQANDNAKNQEHSRTLASLNYMFQNYRNDVIIFPKTGTIYSFNVSPSTVEKGDSAVIQWDTEPGATVVLNGDNVQAKGSRTVSPATSTEYLLKTQGKVSDSSSAKLTVLPTGMIMSFKAIPEIIGRGESTSLVWQAVKGTALMLNGQQVPVKDSITVYPDSLNNIFTLIGLGDIKDSSSIKVQIVPSDQVNRAMGGTLTVSSNDTVSFPYSNPQNIIDGNNTTRWQAIKGNGQWVKIDLGKVIDISKVVIRWAAQAYARSYTVQFSTDLKSWHDLAYVTGGTGGVNNVETLDSLNGTGRYVVFLLQVMAINAISIDEIEIYGVPETAGVSNFTALPEDFSLSQNFPNPFNPSTEIWYSIPKSSYVNITVYNLLGQRVKELVNGMKPAGDYKLLFDASDLSSGVYFYTIRSGSYIKTRKMVLLK